MCIGGFFAKTLSSRPIRQPTVVRSPPAFVVRIQAEYMKIAAAPCGESFRKLRRHVRRQSIRDGTELPRVGDRYVREPWGYRRPSTPWCEGIAAADFELLKNGSGRRKTPEGLQQRDPCHHA